MRRALEVLIAIFLGILITIAVRPLLRPLAPPPPSLPGPETGTPASPPTIPPALNTPAAPQPTLVAPPHPAPTRATAPRPSPPPAAPLLVGGPSPTSRPRPAAPSRTALFIVQVAVAPSREAAARLSSRLRAAEFEPYVVPVRDGFAVRLGAFRERARAVRLARMAATKGFPVTIIEQR